MLKPDDFPPPVRAALGRLNSVSVPPQGMTSHIWLVDGERGRRAVKYTSKPPFTEWLAREYAVLVALKSSGLPTPRPHLLFEAEDGGVFLVMETLPGEPLSRVMARTTDPATRAELMRRFGEMLRRIHSAPTTLPAGSWLDERLEAAAYYLERYAVEGTRALLEHLKRERPAPIPQTLIHGDYMWDNVLVADGEISGVIDWGGGAVGDPRYDLALAICPQDDSDLSAREVDAFYTGYGGAHLSDGEYRFFLGLYEFY